MVTDIKCGREVFLATLFGSNFFTELFAQIQIVDLKKAIFGP